MFLLLVLSVTFISQTIHSSDAKNCILFLNNERTAFSFSAPDQNTLHPINKQHIKVLEPLLGIVKEITFNGLYFQEDTEKVLVPVLRDHQTLEKLTFNNCEFDTKITENVLHSLRYIPKLTKIEFLSMSCPNNFALLKESLCKNTTVTHLSFSKTRIEDEIELDGLNELVKTNSTIKKLNLYDSFDGPGYLEKFIEALDTNKGLTSLDIGSNDINTDIAQKLRNILDKHLTLKTLKCEEMITYLDSPTKDQRKKIRELFTPKPNTQEKIFFSFQEYGSESEDNSKSAE